ncbi:hypothetical protein [Hymenobacter volaticus]|uniref:DUF4267 domain-containing protein n=1 Tax=Hymenobacter volaticus TaxID=2932254 RepID=A0ABY4GFX9_9BACT|nr:hypothetical protein [Hymenobacter volaticus]UOQ69219.1 hypothetical protein MUN86_27585 [Hymenobacter volaticus]
MARLFVAAFPRVVRGILLVYSLGFLIGTYTHVHGVLTHGWLAWPVPRAIGLYWDALTFLDPLTVFLLWRSPRVGLALAVAIMVSDVSVNTLVYLAGYLGRPIPHMVPVSLFDQALFGLFVVSTAPLVWHLLSSTGKGSASSYASPVGNGDRKR